MARERYRISQAIEAAVTAGVRKVVFLSSMSAYFGTRQTYGLMKLAVERTALDLGCAVVRPRLVYGESPGGMAGTLRKISRLPLWPRFKSAKLFLAHEDDVAQAIARVVDHYDELSGQVMGLANPQSVDLPSIFAGLSPSSSAGVACRFLQSPSWPCYGSSRARVSRFHFVPTRYSG